MIIYHELEIKITTLGIYFFAQGRKYKGDLLEPLDPNPIQ